MVHYRLKRHVPSPLIVQSVEKWLFTKNVTKNVSAVDADGAELFAADEKVENDLKTHDNEKTAKQ